MPFQDHQPPALFVWKTVEPFQYRPTTLALKPAAAPLRITLPALMFQTALLASTICVAGGMAVPEAEMVRFAVLGGVFVATMTGVSTILSTRASAPALIVPTSLSTSPLTSETLLMVKLADWPSVPAG